MIRGRDLSLWQEVFLLWWDTSVMFCISIRLRLTMMLEIFDLKLIQASCSGIHTWLLATTYQQTKIIHFRSPAAFQSSSSSAMTPSGLWLCFLLDFILWQCGVLNALNYLWFHFLQSHCISDSPERIRERRKCHCDVKREKEISTLETESIGCTRRKVIFVSIKKESQENNDIFNIDPC